MPDFKYVMSSAHVISPKQDELCFHKKNLELLLFELKLELEAQFLPVDKKNKLKKNCEMI